MNITHIIILLIIAGGIGIINQISKEESKKGKKEKTVDKKQYYRAKSRFFTKPEHMFFQELEKQNNGKYHIFSKVRLEDIVEVLPSLEWKVKSNKRKSIRSRHIDFVLVSKETGKVVKAIELDGKSHNGSKQKQSDDKKDLICKQAEIELIRVKVGESFEETISAIFSI